MCRSFSAAGTEFMEVFVGVGAARVRDMFSKARCPGLSHWEDGLLLVKFTVLINGVTAHQGPRSGTQDPLLTNARFGRRASGRHASYSLTSLTASASSAPSAPWAMTVRTASHKMQDCMHPHKG